METHKVVSHEEWIEARRQLLIQEKDFTRLRDQLSEARRQLPWERVDKDYVFDGPKGEETIGDLFEGRSQLIVYHFMFGPDWEAPCKSCSFWADSFERNVVHLNHRDVALVAVSRAPLSRLEAFKARMGWSFKWVSSGRTDFNPDFHVSPTPEELAKGEAQYNYGLVKSSTTERHGISAFYRDAGGAVFHTYSCYARGVDMMNGAYQYLDLVPKGRDEANQHPYSMAWVSYRDSYGP